MFLVNSRPWLDLQPYIDVAGLEAQRHVFAKAIAMNPHMIFTSLVGTQSNLHDQTLIELGDFAKNIQADEQHPDHDMLKQIGSLPRFYAWCKYMYPVVGLNQAMYIRAIKKDSYGQKHLHDSCYDTPVAAEFGFLFDWIKEQNIFDQYGRVVMFINEPGVSTVLHRDYPNPTSHRNEFIWINLGSAKRFYVYDDAADEKHYIDSRVVYFDNANWHGSDPSQYASWSLRIDGVYSNDFLCRSGTHAHFRK